MAKAVFLPLPSPHPGRPHIQVVDEGLIGTLDGGALVHIQVLGFPELSELSLGSQLLPEGLTPAEGHPIDKASIKRGTAQPSSSPPTPPTAFSLG